MSTKFHRLQFSVPSVLIALLSILRIASAGCYWENGEDRNAAYNATNNYTLTSDHYQPCPANPGASASMCCADGNVCQPNGLCWDPGYAIYWRESCSDQSWQSPGCIKLFINGTGASDDIVVTECDDGSFCYTNKNFDCCSAGEGVYIVNGDQKPHDFNSTSSSTSSSTTSKASQTSTSTLNGAATTTTGFGSGTTSTTNPVPSSGLSTGAKAGIGVGVALGALLVLGLLVWYLMRRRGNKAQAYSNNQNATAPVEKGSDNGTRTDPVKKPFHEVDSDQHVPRVEMPLTQPPMHRDGLAELSNTERR